MQVLLFVLTAVLVGYVVHAFMTSDAGRASDQAPGTEPEPPAAASPEERNDEVKLEAEPVADQPVNAPEPEAASESAPTQYRNPDTGATAAVPSNYRFAKRWIKEALVTEGLLDRVYKNNELDDETSQKVKDALDKFKDLPKYHA
ncbi:MAG: hypothetical protein ACU843_03420 [Gammaproteobacteria bacterium]